MKRRSGSVSSAANSASRASSVPYSGARARSRVVTGSLRLRSTFTVRRSLALVSNSSQAPRLGISLAANSRRPVAGSSSAVK